MGTSKLIILVPVFHLKFLDRIRRLWRGNFKWAALAGATAIAFAWPAMAADAIRIGFVNTFSGPSAAIGNDARNGFELALDHIGRKMDGRPVEVIYEDDQQKPDVGKQKTEKLIQSDHVDFLAGYNWSNVLLASLKPAVDSKTFLIGVNAGPSQLAGELCSPYVFLTSWQNDQTPAAMGVYMNQKDIKSAFLIGPNYAAGKDRLAGFRSRRVKDGDGELSLKTVGTVVENDQDRVHDKCPMK
jgi:branched-chain amino acid transport system substrate-binding protein